MKRALLAGSVVALALAALFLITRPRALDGQSAISIGGPFTLVDGGKHAVTDRDFRGKWMLIYFGYTHCPDVCPTTLGGIAEGITKMPAGDQGRIVPIFITVDPERDTPDIVGSYAHAFGPEFVGLTGSVGEVQHVEAEFRVYAQKHALKNGDYAMDHSSVIYVMGPDGKFAGVLDDTMAPAAMAAQLIKLGA